MTYYFNKILRMPFPDVITRVVDGAENRGFRRAHGNRRQGKP